MDVAIEHAKKRCKAIVDRAQSLSLNPSCKQTLLRLIHSELSFISRISDSSNNPDPNTETSISFNIGHLEALVHILHQPNIAGVSRICKPIPIPPSMVNGSRNASLKGAYVDIVCSLNGNPVWVIVSDRNPKYISWHAEDSSTDKGLRERIQLLLDVARSSVTLKPASMIFFFSNGLSDFVQKKIQDEFGATLFEMGFSDFQFDFFEEVEGEWIDVLAKSYHQATILEIKVHSNENVGSLKDSLLDSSVLGLSGEDVAVNLKEDVDVNLGGSFGSLVSEMNLLPSLYHLPGIDNLINFDTTALIAIVSGISNGNTEKLLATPENELRGRFKGNYEFVIAQVMSEIQNPIHERLCGILSGKRGIICESVCLEFKELVTICGGPNEKLRAEYLLKHLLVVSDSPSERMISLPTTRKLALKNKIVFGTGDHWHAPTLTANMAFVRAVAQTGMSLLTVEHQPRALTGD